MNSIYDNGYQMIGNVKMMKKYIIKSMRNNTSNGDSEMNGTLLEMLEDLEKCYNDNDIVFIDYDRPMGYGIDCFDGNSDRMESEI